MLLLTSTSDLLKLVTSAAGDIEVHASWVDNASGTITPGRTNTASITTATTTTIVAAPGASTQRNVKLLTVTNHHASVTNVVEIYHTDGTNENELWKGTLLAGESALMTEAGDWIVYTSGGARKESSFVGPVDVQVFTATGAGTWTKPTSFTPKVVEVVMWGGGGGGGGGGGCGMNPGLGGAGGAGGRGTIYVYTW
jgi:hypothetical protein